MTKSFQPTLSSRLDGVGEYYFSRKLREIDNMRKEGKKIISLGIGSPDMPPHPSVVARLAQESSKPTAHGYQSYKGAAELREAFASWYDIPLHAYPTSSGRVSLAIFSINDITCEEEAFCDGVTVS